MKIFPELNNKRWLNVNLNEESKKTKADLSDPNICKKWINELHVKNNVDFSYGGFLEDRSNIWRNQYNKKTGAFIHLGVDFNVPEGTKVALPKKAVVEHIMIDKDQNGGWGGRVIFKIEGEENYILFGHLNKNISLKKGDVVEAGEIFAEVGRIDENGGWFPHLHVQMMSDEFMELFKENLAKIDGYAKEKDLILKYVINPMKYIRV